MEMLSFANYFLRMILLLTELFQLEKSVFPPTTKGVRELIVPYLSITVRVTGLCWRYNMRYFTNLYSDRNRRAFSPLWRQKQTNHQSRNS